LVDLSQRATVDDDEYRSDDHRGRAEHDHPGRHDHHDGSLRHRTLHPGSGLRSVASAGETVPLSITAKLEHTRRTMEVFAVRPYQPSARRVYQPAALP
jgi:hypothetical protein